MAFKQAVSKVVSAICSAGLAEQCCLCHAQGQPFLKTEPIRDGLCFRCLALLRRPILACSGCGLSHQCDCNNQDWHLDRTLFLQNYQAPIDHFIVDFKFHGKPALARPLGAQLGWLFALAKDAESTPATLVPVPLSPQRLRHRGFNQSELLCRAMKRTNAKFEISHLIQRIAQPNTKELPAQAQSSRKDRLLHSQHRYQLRKGPTPEMPAEIVLIDDVMTTGATLNQCAALLKASGVKSVCAIVVARTPR